MVEKSLGKRTGITYATPINCVGGYTDHYNNAVETAYVLPSRRRQ